MIWPYMSDTVNSLRAQKEDPASIPTDKIYTGRLLEFIPIKKDAPAAVRYLLRFLLSFVSTFTIGLCLEMWAVA